MFDLFAALDATDEQLDFPILYGSAKQGWMADSLDGPKRPGHGAAVRSAGSPRRRRPRSRPGRSACSAPSWRPIPISAASSPAASRSGSVKPNQAVKVLDRDGTLIEQGRITKVLAFRGLERQPIDEGMAGDIVAIAGLPEATVSHTSVRSRGRPAAAGAADRSADAGDDLPHQRFAARRHRRRQGAEPGDPRAAAARGRGQRRAADLRNRTRRIPWRSPAAANCSSAF